MVKKSLLISAALALFAGLAAALAGCAGWPAPDRAGQAAADRGWARVTTPDYEVELPARWEIHPINAKNVAAELQIVAQVSPFFAQSVGGEAGLLRFSLWAFDPAGEPAGFRDSMNVSAIPIEGEPEVDLQATLELLKTEYARGGAQVTEGELVELGGQPALRVSYSFRAAGLDGEPVAVEGRQYFLLAGENIWILSFLIDPAHLGEAVTMIERSVESFQALE
jgi:hypothetical protein